MEELKLNTGKQEGAWMDKTGEDWDGLHLDKFEKRWPTFFQIYVSLYHNNIQATISAFWLVKNMSINPKSVQKSVIECKNM